jgi:hypothetical protein
VVGVAGEVGAGGGGGQRKATLPEVEEGVARPVDGALR